VASGLLLLVPSPGWRSPLADVFGRFAARRCVLVVSARAAAAVVIIAALRPSRDAHRLRATSADSFGPGSPWPCWPPASCAQAPERRVERVLVVRTRRAAIRAGLLARELALSVPAGSRHTRPPESSRYAPVRYLAITLFIATLVKVALPIWPSSRVYRVLSVMALGS
jgi:hypothetical protein